MPDVTTAAIKATETLIKFHISAAPVDPLPMLKALPGVLVLPFTEIAEKLGADRKQILSTFDEAKDALTFVENIRGRLKYFVVYNQRLPNYIQQRALARELGHILLGHDGSRPEDVRTEEAMYFARHLICPRPVLHAVRQSGIPLTVEVVGNITGCYEKCIAGMQKTPGAQVPAQLNKIVREPFTDYIEDFLDYLRVVAGEDDTSLANFGTFMDGYEE